MEWASYWAVVRRRWILIGLILLLDVAASGYLYRKATRAAGSQACLTLYVADVSSPSLISAPSSTLETAGQLLAGETAANFFADDILDVAQSRRVSQFMNRRSALVTGGSGFDGTVSGSRMDRTVNLCVTHPDGNVALRGATALAAAMSVDRGSFIGRKMAARTFVTVVSPPSVGPAPVSRSKADLLLRLGLGVLVALGLALTWDALDPNVRDRRDVEAALGAPVLTSGG